MAERAWLHDQVHSQLALGHSWLEESLKAKAAPAKPSAAVDRKWAGIYHDNGSCIDISGPLSPLDATLLVLQTRPLLLVTDGHHHAHVSLTPACRNDLRARYPGRDIATGTRCTVKKYTIRYTSYGPPRDHLRLFLDALDWVGEDHGTKICADSTRALTRCSDIHATLRLLFRTREREDNRCLLLRPEKEDDTDGASHTMAGADDTHDQHASMNTQLPFNTQVQHPIRARRSDDEVAFVGINRMEPVLAGNTQRAELKPRSASSETQRQKEAKLLSLIGRVPQPQPPPHSPGHQNHANARPDTRKPTDHPVTPNPPLPAGTPRKQVDRATKSSPTSTDKGKKRMRETSHESPSTHHSAKRPSFAGDEPQHSRTVAMDKFAAECSWMKGLKLNRAASTVPDDQANILQKPESWYKPQPGARFPGPNMPIQTLVALSRMADEKAALEGATSSGSYNQTDPSSGSYPPNSAPHPTEEHSSESEEDIPPSPVSWSISPSPEPPQRPTMSRQGLPPDSSNEVPVNLDEAMPLPVAAGGHRPPNSTLPNSSYEANVGLPPSSPPVHHAADDTDDDMELETSIPQALGEDLEAGSTARPSQHHLPYAAPEQGSLYHVKENSVVQVKETPYAKAKHGQQPVVTISPPTQKSNKSLESSSSASVVRATYQDVSSSMVEETRLDALRRDDHNDQEDSATSKHQTYTGKAPSFPEHDPQDTSMTDVFVDEDRPFHTSLPKLGESRVSELQTITAQTGAMQPEPTPVSAQVPPKDSSSGEQPNPTPNANAPINPQPQQPERELSRKPSNTPSLKRKSSPKEIRERGKRLKKFSFASRKVASEGRGSTTSVESRSGSMHPVQQLADTTINVSEVKTSIKPQPVVEENQPAEASMSPRHQSLYEDPSPKQRPAVGHSTVHAPSPTRLEKPLSVEEVVEDAVEQIAQDKSQDAPPPPRRSAESQQDMQPEPMSGPAPVRAPVPTAVTEPKAQVYPSPSGAPAREEQTPTVAPLKEAAHMTVFDKFKAAYPDYTGSVKIFANICKYMNTLDQEEKMVPKWMWDDFIIRKQIDYRVHLNECIETGEDPIPYIRFYKDKIRGADYKKGIIDTKAVLLKALEELGVQTGVATSPSPQGSVEPAIEPSVFETSTPVVQQTKNVVRSHERSLHPPPQQGIPPSPQQTARLQSRPSMPLPTQSTETPIKRKPSRKSLPFQTPSSWTPTQANSTARVRHSLGAGAPHASTQEPTFAQHTPSARPRPTSAFGNSLRDYALSASTPPSLASTGNKYRDFALGLSRMTSVTGSRGADASKPWPENLSNRPSLSDLCRDEETKKKKNIDVLKWGDEL